MAYEGLALSTSVGIASTLNGVLNHGSIYTSDKKKDHTSSKYWFTSRYNSLSEDKEYMAYAWEDQTSLGVL